MRILGASYRHVEDLLAELGLAVSYETVRTWFARVRTGDSAAVTVAPSPAERSIRWANQRFRSLSSPAMAGTKSRPIDVAANHDEGNPLEHRDVVERARIHSD